MLGSANPELDWLKEAPGAIPVGKNDGGIKLVLTSRSALPPAMLTINNDGRSNSVVWWIQLPNITLASNDPLKIIIINEQGLPNLVVDDKITVEILCKAINFGAEYIKVVGRFLRKLN